MSPGSIRFHTVAGKVIDEPAGSTPDCSVRTLVPAVTVDAVPTGAVVFR
jgi:hypothetical protein